jgi:hypothetical protein
MRNYMKTKQELLQILFAKLAELQDLNKKEFTTKTVWETANLTAKLQTEVALLYDILGEDVPEEYWEQIEEVI